MLTAERLDPALVHFIIRGGADHGSHEARDGYTFVCVATIEADGVALIHGLAGAIGDPLSLAYDARALLAEHGVTRLRFERGGVDQEMTVSEKRPAP